MIYKLDSIDRVIARIVKDLGLGVDEIPYQDFVEWIADGLEHIGSYYQFQEKECNIIIENYEGMLPCDFYKSIRLLNKWEIPTPSSGGFYGGSLALALQKLGIDWSKIPAYDQFHIIDVAGLSSNEAANNGISNLSFNNNLIGNSQANKFTDVDYNINFNKVTTSFQYGILSLQYLAMPVDERGFPMVPDDVSFRDALFWKVAMQLCMRNPTLLANPTLQKFDYCQAMWYRYCGQARANANMPDLEGMIRIKNNWLRMVNNPDFDLQLFGPLGKQDTIKLDK